MYTGQRVLCIDDRNQMAGCGPDVKEGEVYIIRGFSKVTTGLYLEGMYLDEIEPGVERAYLRRRFRPVDEDNFVEELLARIEEKVEQEHLQIIKTG